MRLYVVCRPIWTYPNIESMGDPPTITVQIATTDLIKAEKALDSHYDNQLIECELE